MTTTALNAPIAADDIVWETPPSPPRGRVGRPITGQFADALRNHPGEWALYGEYESHRAAYSARSKLINAARRFAPGESWEVVSRKIDDHLWKIYIRWTGYTNTP